MIFVIIKLHGEGSSAPHSSFDRIKDIIKDYNPECIFNMDECALL